MRTGKTPFIVSLFINSFIILAYYSSVSPNGSWFWISLSGFLFLPILFALIMILLSLFAFIMIRPLRKSSVKVFIFCAAYFIAGFICVGIAHEIRAYGFYKLAKRSAPLVNAIKSYQKKYNNPPTELAVLVPEFLPKIPNTGIGAYPYYEYRVVKKSEFNKNVNSWELFVDTPIGFINWDMFVYNPEQNYSNDNFEGGDWYEPIGDWAYFHE